MHTREALTLKLFWQSLKDYDLWYLLHTIFTYVLDFLF